MPGDLEKTESARLFILVSSAAASAAVGGAGVCVLDFTVFTGILYLLGYSAATFLFLHSLGFSLSGARDD